MVQLHRRTAKGNVTALLEPLVASAVIRTLDRGGADRSSIVDQRSSHRHSAFRRCGYC